MSAEIELSLSTSITEAFYEREDYEWKIGGVTVAIFHYESSQGVTLKDFTLVEPSRAKQFAAGLRTWSRLHEGLFC